MTFTDTGSVGIRTTEPKATVDIRGHVNIQDNNGAAVISFPNSGQLSNLYIRSDDDPSTHEASSERMFIGGNGNVGIGTTTPLQKLHVQGNAIIKSTLALVGPGSGIEGGELLLADPEQTQFGEVNSWAIDNYRVNGTSHLRFFYDDGDPDGVMAMSILSNGNVGIGVSEPENALDVCGTIRSQEWVVELMGCDFVFDAGYKLPDFKKRKDFIRDYGHLMYVASAPDMQRNGAAMANTTMGILRNVEEHELYLHGHEDRLEALESENTQLRKELEEIKKQLSDMIKH